MRKITILLLLAFILTMAGTAGVWGVVPGYEDVYSQYKIAEYTLEFLEYYGERGTGTFWIYNDSDYTNDEVIEQTLKSCWTMVPIRALSESLDFQVDWVAEERKVEIKEKPGGKRIPHPCL